MLRVLHSAGSGESYQTVWAELISACARNRGDSALWTEFLYRYGAKIKQFIRGTWRLSIAGGFALGDSMLGGVEENDLFQSTILRLVEQDCAALKRFSGTSEDEWLAYLAVITRSVVRDALRHRNRLKRSGETEARRVPSLKVQRADWHREGLKPSAMEREVLAREVRSLFEQEIHSNETESCARNLLIFRLYFEHELTAKQIAACRGVNLTKTGVEKVINRLKERVRSVVSPDAPEDTM
jgi:RNA polymerase sigma factor (sigma-70 family)